MGNSIVPFEPGALAELDAETDEEPGFNPVPIRLKIVHDEAEFSLPGLPNQDTMEAVILAAMRVRVFFPNMGTDAVSEELINFTSKRPFCRSSNYVSGDIVDADWEKAPEAAVMLKGKIAAGALACLHCPLDAWGSVEILGKTGNGKACNELRRMCLWRPGWNVPVIVSFPSTSIRSWDEYCSSLSIGNLKPHYVVTKMSLTKVELPGRNYSVAGFKMANTITPEMQAEMLTPVNLRGETQSLAKALIDIFKRRELSEEDYPINGETDKDEAGTDEDELGGDF